MTEDEEIIDLEREEESRDRTRPRSWLRRAGLAIAVLLGLLIMAGLVGLSWLNSDNGHGFVARQIEAYEFENGMQVDIGSIEGSLFGALTLRDVALRDPNGVFASAPRIDLDWRPFAYLSGHMDIRALLVPEMRLRRLPAFKQTPPSDQPWLPDLDIDVNRLAVNRLVIDPPVTGQRHIVTLAGDVHIADRTAQVMAKARALNGTDVAGGDRLMLDMTAAPDRNQLNLALDLEAPANGLVAALSGVAKPVTLRLAGKGDWERWRGKLTGKSGADQLSNLALLAQDGTFAVKGMMRPGLLLSGSSVSLFEPETNVDITAAAKNRQVTLTGGLSNAAFSLNADGMVDLGENRARNFALDFRLLEPRRLATNLVGDGIIAEARFDGPFASPAIAYRIAADRIGFDQTVVIGLNAEGQATMSEQGWRIPVQASARRVTGLNAATGELLENVRIDGDLAYANAKLMSDNLRIRSRRINAIATVLADLSQGVYTGALDGRIDGYRVDGIGTFNILTDVKLKSDQAGTFRLDGRVKARSAKIFSDGVREFLGGNALIVADVSYDSKGVARVSRLNVAAPSFRLTSGSGRYTQAGGIAFNAKGLSDTYGPLAVKVSGTTARPVARIEASRPGLGVGLADLVATVRGNGRGYAVLAEASSDYGPLAADAFVVMGPGAMTITLKDGTSYAGVGLTGQLRQTPAGPFAGELLASGSGVEGTVALSSQAGFQHALVDATAQDAALPGAAGLSIGRAIIKADVLLADRPKMTADLQLADLVKGDMTIVAARGKVDYEGGVGTAKLMVEGRNKFPFRFAANADLAENLWRIALEGRANGVDFSTASPARIEKAGGEYRLLPTTIDLSKGSIQLAGRYGRGLVLQSRLDKVDLSLINPIIPGLGIGGTATGSLDFEQTDPNAFPKADARLRIDDFTRTSLASVSQPVDIHLVGRLLADGGNARAIVRRRGAAIGRMQVDLRPLPPGAGPWTTRLLAAPLSGGLRYNGPADTLFSLAALPDQSLKGAIGVAADFSGRVQKPQLSGVVRANNLTYENGQYGTRLTNMKLRGSFTGDRMEVEELSAKAGEGTISGKGFVSLSSDQGFPVQLQLDLDHARLARSDDLSTTATGQLRLVNSADQPATITGRIALPETRYKIVRQGSAQVVTLTGVRRKPPKGRKRVTADAEPITGVPTNWRLDVDIVADNQVYVSGMGLNSEWSAKIHVGGTTGNPVITGGIDLVRGTLGFAGRSFDLEEGELRFNGGSMTNPTVRLVASGEADDVTVNINVTGSGENPDIAFSSTPSLPQDEIMSRILFGNSIGELSAVQAVQLAASLNALRGGSGGLNPLGVLQSASGIDRLRILGADKDTGQGTSLAVGQYISNDIYVEIVTDARGHTATQIEVSLTPALSILSQVSSLGGSSANIQYRKDY